MMLIVYGNMISSAFNAHALEAVAQVAVAGLNVYLSQFFVLCSLQWETTIMWYVIYLLPLLLILFFDPVIVVREMCCTCYDVSIYYTGDEARRVLKINLGEQSRVMFNFLDLWHIVLHNNFLSVYLGG